MADQEPSMSQVSQATGNESLNIPPAKMIRLEDLEKTVLGLVGKSLDQTTPTNWGSHRASTGKQR